MKRRGWCSKSKKLKEVVAVGKMMQDVEGCVGGGKTDHKEGNPCVKYKKVKEWKKRTAI